MREEQTLSKDNSKGSIKTMMTGDRKSYCALTPRDTKHAYPNTRKDHTVLSRVCTQTATEVTSTVQVMPPVSGKARMEPKCVS